MALSTEEVALVILVAVAAEQNHNPADMRLRRSLGDLTKQLMARHHWQELDFLQGWGLIMSEKLAEVREHEGAFFPCLTDAGRAFVEEQQVVINKAAHRGIMLSGKDWLFIIGLGAVLLRFAMVLWYADH